MKQDIYQQVTDRIISQLEQGVVRGNHLTFQRLVYPATSPPAELIRESMSSCLEVCALPRLSF